MKTTRTALGVVLLCLVGIFSFAGESDLDCLKIVPVTGSGATYSLEITNASGTDEFIITQAGVPTFTQAATFSSSLRALSLGVGVAAPSGSGDVYINDSLGVGVAAPAVAGAASIAGALRGNSLGVGGAAPAAAGDAYVLDSLGVGVAAPAVAGVVLANAAVRAPAVSAADGTAAITIANGTGVVGISTRLNAAGDIATSNVKASDGTAALSLTNTTGAVGSAGLLTASKTGTCLTNPAFNSVGAANFTSDVNFSKGILLPETSAPSMTASTSAGLLWNRTNHKLYIFANGSWVVVGSQS